MHKNYIESEGYDALDKTVRARGNTGGVSAPRLWIGLPVTAILLGKNDPDKKQYKQGEQRRKEIPVEKKIYRLHGYEIIRKIVKKDGTGALVNLPVSWVGKRVKVILIEKPKKED